MSEADDRTRSGADPHLISLVQMANAFGLEQSLVLTLAGQVITGTLIGAKTYADQLAVAVQGEDPDETMRGSLAARFRKSGEELAEWGAGSQLGELDPEAPDADDLPSMPDPDFVHLRDATVGEVGVPMWRGRLDGVIGWSILKRSAESAD